MVRLVLLAAVLGLTLAALPAQGAATATCSTKTVDVAGGYKLVRLTATEVSCAKARSVAVTLARQLQRTGSVSVPGVAGFSVSTRMCTGCGTTTDISLSYSSGGKVIISLVKRGGADTPAPVLPQPGPGPLTPGPGPLTV